MRLITLIAACLILPGAALACDDHAGTCEIEDWKHSYTGMMEALIIDGVTTCDTGQIRLRLYDGDGEARRLLAVETAYIDGHIFKALVMPVETRPKLSTAERKCTGAAE